MPIATESLDRLREFIEQHQMEDVEEATRLYNTVPVIREMSMALSRFVHVVYALSLYDTSDHIDNPASEAANLTRIFAITLYLIGYRAGQEQSDSEVGNGLV